MKEDDIGMYLPMQDYDGQTGSTDISIKRVLNQSDLLDFSKVYAAIGGYENVYADLYSKVPDSLIEEGSPYEMYVGYSDGQPVLTGILVLHADVAGIYYVMTVEEKRCKGYGTHMMQFLINKAKKRGAPLVTLQASADGRGLYEKLGFKSICRFVEYA